MTRQTHEIKEFLKEKKKKKKHALDKIFRNWNIWQKNPLGLGFCKINLQSYVLVKRVPIRGA